MENILYLVGMGSQWLRAQPWFKEWMYAVAAVVVSFAVYAYATPGFTSLDWRTVASGWFEMLKNLVFGQAATSSAAYMVSRVTDHKAVPVTANNQEG